MELVERYLGVVRFWLPRSGDRDDILRELRDEIGSQLDERRSSLGREPAESEVADLLRQFGHPFAVAGRFLPDASLIGSAMFPVYAQVVRVLLWVLGSGAAAAAIAVLLVPGHSVGKAADIVLRMLMLAIFAFGLVTLLFAALDRYGGPLAYRWDPRTLPAMPDPLTVRRDSAIMELTIRVAFLAVWLMPALIDPPLAALASVGWLPGAIWSTFHQSCFGMVAFATVAPIAIGIHEVARPTGTPRRFLLRSAVNALWAAILFNFSSAAVSGLAEHGLRWFLDREYADASSRMINDELMQLGFLGAAAMCWITAAVDLWRASRRPPRPIAGHRLKRA